MTRSKSTCGGCCCNQCERHLPENVRCCCHCVCDTLCVILEIPFDVDCPCTTGPGPTTISREFGYDCETNSWHGTIECAGLSVDLDFSIKRCDPSGSGIDRCYICLKSTCLNKSGDCIPGTDCIEVVPGRDFCRGVYANDIERTGGFDAVFGNIEFSDCDTGVSGGNDCLGIPDTGSITISCSDRLFPSCFKDCKSVVCDGCSCLPLCLCIDYHDDSCPEPSACDEQLNRRVCYDNDTKSWSTEFTCGSETIDLQFTLQENEDTGLCEIFITSTALGISESTPQPGESTEANPQTINCDNFNPTWSYDFSGRNISINLISGVCNVCNPVFGCCTNRTTAAPLVLNVETEITGAHECNPVDCPDGGEITFQLHFVEIVRRGDPFPDPDFSCALKYVGNTVWCGQPATMTVWLCDTCAGGVGSDPGITVEFQTCDGGDIHCSTGGTGCDCRSMTCVPFFFTTSDLLGGGSPCCNADDATTLDITITE